MATPRPTPTNTRLLRGDTSKGKNPIPTNDLRLKPEIPPMPKFASKKAAAFWKRFTEMMESTKVIACVDGFLLEMFCVTWAMWHDAIEDVAKQGQNLVNGLGVTYRNPNIITAADTRKDLLRMMIEMGLTPAARTKVMALSENSSDPLNSFVVKGKFG